ncbi:hypothetical protein QN355_04280 [Cryobacterium sp. 10S3]|uniref:hypothetical protein n=1 Tax=Cryobacterium sp. 10S3 TaxID=3048582 RepID=UPI002AC90384|nr:hypothetical protein [Cryobacterium sp. 10S3]MEB0285766.1 hypothetical protein [Cryobacterium sp. 10S3]WPX12372.1 hypothetical protein RHM57_11860 [Cryobacterium sp. 10S3]
MNTPEFPETPAPGTTAPPASADNRREITAWPALRTLAWHRPLLAATAAMAVLVVVCLVGLLVDPRSLTGAPVWAKPLKFSISVLVYAASLAWLLGILSARRRRLAWWIGTVSTIALVIEMVIIVGDAALGITSHFNVSTPVSATLWSVMAFSIVLVWMAALVTAVLLFRTDLGDPARALAIRAGTVIAVLGMGLAFLMTGPTAAQLDHFQGIAGAHTVGVPDGGPGLPLLGWSTVAGDLRIPHFVGMHALQVIPLTALLLEVLARRVALVRPPTVRFRLLAVVIALYVGVLAILTGQALAGESIVRPDALVTTLTIALVAAVAVAATLVLSAASRAAIPPTDAAAP